MDEAIRKIAGLLLQNYRERNIPDLEAFLPDLTSLENGLKNLFASGDLNPDIIGLLTGHDSSIVLGAIEAGVRTFQQATGANQGGLDADGILGRQTLKWITTKLRCVTAPQLASSLEATDSDSVIRYHFLNPLPPVSGLRSHVVGGMPFNETPETLFQDGLNGWVARIFVTPRLVSESEANVIIKTGPMPASEPPTTLAMADIGPPQGSRKYFYTFDVTEVWDRDKFLSTAAHEWGHILGLRHSTVPGSLMYKYRQSGVMTPTDSDIAALPSKWIRRQ